MKTQLFFASFFSLLVGCSSNGMSPLPASSGVSPRAQRAIDHGPVAPDTVFDLVIGVRMRNETKLLLAHQYEVTPMSPEDFGDAFGASRFEYAQFATWLRAQGAEIVRTTPSRTTVTVRATAEVIARLFGVEVHQFEDRYGVFVAPTTALSAANEALDVITGVVGVDNSYPWATHLAPPILPGPDAAPGTGAQTPSDMEQRYFEDIATITKPGMGQTVAILSTNMRTKSTDLDSYLSTYKPAGVTALATGQYSQVEVGGPSRDPDDTNAYGENVLDPEMVLATAPYAKIIQVFTATNGGGLFADGIAYIVNDLATVHAVTVSWGTCERGAGGEMPVLNALLAQAKAEGQQWFFASGDYGVDGCRDMTGNKIFSAGWPASSPFAVGVGGTQPVSGTVGPGGEKAWSGSGGGPSEALDKPAYQTMLTPADSSRDEPDLSAVASAVAYTDSVNGGGAIGGTSAATPIVAGLWAVLVQQKAPTTGIKTAHESLYTLAKAGNGFTDITTGTTIGPSDTTNGGYAAKTGYDYATGLGTPNLTSLIANWQ